MVVAGGYGNLVIRAKQGARLELGELLIAETPTGNVLLQIFDLDYGSQLSQQHLELVSGLKLEEDTTLNIMDPHLRTYVLAKAQGLLAINGVNAKLCKELPGLFSPVRELTAADVPFFTTPKTPLLLGNLRSGSTTLNVPIALPGVDVLSHHVLISATTGKGKSNLAYTMLWDLCNQDYAGVLVLDPHDEYYGRTKRGLKDHPRHERVISYSPDPMPGARTLKINLSLMHPQHFDGVMPWSDAQRECIMAYWKRYGEHWIEEVLTGEAISNFMEGTLAVVRRRLQQLLDLQIDDTLTCEGVFDTIAGVTIVHDIVRDLEQGKIVIIDTSSFSGAVEILIGSIIASETLHRYKQCKQDGSLKDKPVISIFLEEAPRVLGKDALEKGGNIFSTIAREGRKFNVGLVAITQLPSLIPRDILANINTKIILGTEMKPERQALIESAAQDLSEHDRTIASLDKGEAIITSTFVKCVTPIKIPLFDTQITPKQAQSFPGVKS